MDDGDEQRLGVATARDNVLTSLLVLERELNYTTKSSETLSEIRRFGTWLELELEDDPLLLSEADAIPGGSASLLSSMVNLAKTCVGTGILTLPFAFSGCGLLWGFGFTLLTGAMASFTLFLLGEVATFGGPQPTLHVIGMHAAGTFGSVLVDLSVCANNVGAMISYLVIASTTVEKIVHQNGMAGWPRQAYVLIGVTLVAPLCIVRHVNMLRFSSSIAMMALALVTVMIVLFAIPWDPGSPFEPCTGGGTACKGNVEMSSDALAILTQFVIFTNAYTCQHAMLPIVAELDRPTRRRRCIVIFGAMGAVCFLLLVVGTAGYLTFGDTVDSNVLFSYPKDSMFVVLALVGIIIDVLSSYPLLMYMTRISIVNLVNLALDAAGCHCQEEVAEVEAGARSRSLPGTPSSSRRHSTQSFGNEDDLDVPDPWRHVYIIPPMEWSDFISNRFDLLCTLLIMIFTISVALAVSDLGIVAALTGATGATMIGYVVPGLLYVLLHRRYSGPQGEEGAEELISNSEYKFSSTYGGTYYGALIIFLLGCVLVPVGVTLTLNSS